MEMKGVCEYAKKGVLKYTRGCVRWCNRECERVLRSRTYHNALGSVVWVKM